MELQVESLLRGGQFKQILDNYVRNLREKYDLKRIEIEVLYYLSHNTTHNSAKDISFSLHMNKGHVSQTTDSLSKKGYITASKDTVDYRIMHYTITNEANCVVEEIDAAIDRLYTVLFEGISVEEQAIFAHIAGQIASNINRFLQQKP